MTKTQHKPEWHIVIDSADRKVVRTVEAKPRSVIVADSWVRDDDLNKIVAAPELLTALSNLVFMTEGIFGLDCQQLDAISEAKAAIAKATGEA